MAEDIRTLVAQYFELVDPAQLAIPHGNVLVRNATQAALYERMFHESLTPLPPASYRARVLKLILARIEESISDPDEDEILDDLIECWGNLVSQPKPTALQQAQELSHIKYTTPLQSPPSPSEREVIIIESRGLILSGGTTGNRTWEAALHLGSFLASPTGEALVRGQRVIELGAGTGFLSLLCARHLGVQGVVATDREPVLIENMRNCIDLNLQPSTNSSASLPFYPAIWDWGTPLGVTGELAPFVENGGLRFDIALGADLIYDADLVPLLISTVRDLFENYHVKQFIIAATLRNENTFQTFLDACGTASFNVEQLPFASTPSKDQTGFFHSTRIPIRTYRIERKT
ncbi:hypothetical protein N7462_000207 [Penicillium macrosclerotiorum]|uniref:uncharacterized protein n=1 Tax=Penicillium macrosclerotiorum TaxID=303699 RepID=UPI002548B3F0|nr:uncharacterized protein N7462_000207 [Penicillium macrosclerotiorum]KAJ5698202.1 hypothetical protein N7462_000207 [Penicillium macrosclerotiorum]